ncbi:MAG: hypothetical protein WCB18_04610 [Thermoplasmata archaeon]
MPELPDSQRVPQPTPRVVSGVRIGDVRRPRAGSSRHQDPPIVSDRTHGPATVFVGGPSRPVVNGVAFALAETIDLTPFWLDLRNGLKGNEGPDPGNTGWIPPDRMFVSENGQGLEIGNTVVEPALWTIVRSDEPQSVLSNLTDFLRLPQLIQEILSAVLPNGGPKALVAANSDRVAHLFPRTADGLQKFLATLAASSLSIVAAHTGPTSPGRFGFGTVFRLEVQTPEQWMEGTIICEKGIEQGPFAIGRTNRLSDVPSIARVFRGLYPAKS